MLIQPDEEVDGPQFLLANGRDVFGQLRPCRRCFKIGNQLLGQCRVVFERKLLGFFLEEEIEGIDDGQFGHQVDFDRKFSRLLRKHEPGQAIAVRILLPVDEMRLGLNGKRITQHRRSAMRRRSQSKHLRRKPYRTRISIGCLMIERYANGHVAGIRLHRKCAKQQRRGGVRRRGLVFDTISASSNRWKEGNLMI